MGKKNLDKLFQEKFSDFSEMPDEKVWQSIEASLDKKKKSRRVIPIWWKLGGVAAVLLFAIFLINPFEEPKDSILPSVTDIETPEKQSDVKTEESQPLTEFEKTNRAVTNVDNTGVSEGERLRKEVRSETSTQRQNGPSKSKDPIDLGVQKSKSQIAGQNNAAQKQNLENNRETHPSIDDNLAAKSDRATVVDNYKSNPQHDIENETSNTNASNSKEIHNQKETGIAQTGTNTISPTENKAYTKKSIFDEIADQEAEKEEVVEAKKERWSAGPSVAPVYFDAIGEGSPVHSIFVPNSKSGDLNLSYGLSVAYEINDKLKVRSGVHRVDYGYSTNDIEFSSSLESSSIGQITNVNYSATARNIVVGSNAGTSTGEVLTNDTPIVQEFSSQDLAQNGTMNQQFGYLEVPVELEYALLDKKFGINLIGGVSSLFLVDNSISLSSGELTTEMGEANNVNDVNFSTNVGIGLNYRFTPKVRLNLEPVFKYQLNTFSQTDGTFQPFTVGIYSGVSFRF